MLMPEKPANLLAAAAGALLLSACTGTTSVELVNRSPQPLEAVTVQFTGGATAPRSLQPGTAATVNLDPSGESHLEITYRSAAGPQNCRIDTYLEPGYRAEFRIELQERSCRVTHEEIESSPYLGSVVPGPSPNNSSKPTPLRGAA